MSYWMFATKDGEVKFLASAHRSFIAGAAVVARTRGFNVRTGIATWISMGVEP